MTASDAIHELMLHEELLLLALDGESGSGSADLALAGGLVAELAFRGAILIENEGEKAFVRSAAVQGATSAIADGGELLAECLDDVNASDKRREASHWINQFSAKKGLKARTARPLVERGVLDERKRKVLLFFETTKYPEANPVPEALLTERLRSALEHDHIAPDGRTVAVLAIADAASLLDKTLDKKMVRARQDRLKELSEGDHISAAVKSAIDAVTAMIAVAVAAGVVATS